MYNNYRCDVCNSSMATDKVYVKLTTTTQDVDICQGCVEVVNENDLLIVARFLQTRAKARFLRNMPKKDWLDAMEGDK